MLITVKASPEIGRTHGETVCVAGVRLDQGEPSWIRLFPVPWQWFWRKEHPKYQVVDVDVVKHDRDQRPESYRPLLDSAEIFREKSTSKQRTEELNRLRQYSMCDLVAAKGWSRPSLGLVIPRKVTGFGWEDHTGEAGHAMKMNWAAQGSLLAQDAPKLQFSPFAFKLSYLCMTPTCRGHQQSIADWEISEAWRKWRHDYPADYLDRIKEKWLSLVQQEKYPAFFVGNQHQAPQGFLILGIVRGITRTEPSPVDPGASGGPLQSSDDTSTDQPRSTEGRLFDL